MTEPAAWAEGAQGGTQRVETLRKLRSRVLAGRYLLTTHALDEMADEEIMAEDIEKAILVGRIVERQVDLKSHERKYVILGPDMLGNPIAVVARLALSGSIVVITTYRE